MAQTPPPAKQAPAKTAPAKTAPASTAAPAAPKLGPPPPALLNPAALKAKAPDLYRVKFVTTKGDITVEVHRDWAPLGADRLYNLVKNKYFTDCSFYRYVPGFIVQFGSSAWPQVTKAWENAKIKDDPLKESNKKGTLTFATSGPDSRTTELFFNLRDNAPLDTTPPGFRPVGMVTEGMDIVEGLYSGYGDMKEMGGRGPSQSTLAEQGKPYLDKNFPQLDSIKSATVIFPEATATPAKTAAPATKSATPAPKSATPPAATKKQ